MGSRFTLTNALRVLRSPTILFGELRHHGLKLNQSYTRNFGEGGGLDVMEADWDNLVLLDACRYDAFKERNHLEGELQRVRSQGSHSVEFLTENFAGKQFHDTVYVSSNPYTHVHLAENTFHDIINVFDDGWDESMQTVPPEAIVSATLEAHDRYPNKRIISHFMQPHQPFIGNIGEQFDQMALSREADGGDSIWVQLQYRVASADVETVWEAYLENLDIVLQHVEELTNELEGKSVVSADHGELFGERGFPVPVRMYGHHRGVRVPEVIEVPWLELPSESRRSVTAEKPVAQREPIDDETIEDRLSNLGYV